MKLFYRLLDVLCVLLIFGVLSAYIIVATGIFERQLTTAFAVAECQGGFSLAACDWLEEISNPAPAYAPVASLRPVARPALNWEFGSEATVLRAAQAGSEDR